MLHIVSVQIIVYNIYVLIHRGIYKMCDIKMGYCEQDATEIAKRNYGDNIWNDMYDKQCQEAADAVAMARDELRNV